MEQARDNLSKALRDPERRSWIEEEVQKQQEHFDNVRQDGSKSMFSSSLIIISWNFTLGTSTDLLLHHATLPISHRSLWPGQGFHMLGSSLYQILYYCLRQSILTTSTNLGHCNARGENSLLLICAHTVWLLFLLLIRPTSMML